GALLAPKRLRTWMVVVPVVTAFGFLGIFERVREFIRKPYIIGGYLYSNLLVEEDYPIYQRDGVLAHATYTTTPKITESNLVEAGRNVFLLTCSRCHTTHGINSIVGVFERMYGKGKPLDPASMAAYIPNMHNGRTYMPPFPGNAREVEALAVYIRDLQLTGTPLEGAQSDGVAVNPAHTAAAVSRMIIEAGDAAPSQTAQLQTAR
ncbi:MAG: c-type cytochrome, partial [Flavobacteriales bacterium]